MSLTPPAAVPVSLAGAFVSLGMCAAGRAGGGCGRLGGRAVCGGCGRLGGVRNIVLSVASAGVI